VISPQHFGEHLILSNMYTYLSYFITIKLKSSKEFTDTVTNTDDMAIAFENTIGFNIKCNVMMDKKC
jgi:hypothetical protein